ncbi:hypothetical protein JW962_02815 [Candidatus Dojkabacteria bacterium]|nr:hypothetical protein [Candidatus Dojkabacteria bacterium]
MKKLKTHLFRLVKIFLLLNLIIGNTASLFFLLSNPVLADTPEDYIESNENQIWIQNTDGSFTSNEPITIGTYVFPNDPSISITFTKVDEPGIITINKIPLTTKQIEETSAIYPWALEVTSTMPNYSFEFTLTLPNNSEPDSTIAYSEDSVNFAQLNNVSTVENSIIAENVDHFTIFIVINPNPVGNGNACVVATVDGICYDTIQEAINASSNGDTVQVTAGTYSGNIIIDKEITLQGNGNGTDPLVDTILSSNSGAAAITVTASNVNIGNLRVTPVNSAGIQVGIMTNSPVGGDPIAISNLTISDVMVIGPATYFGTETEIGLKVMVHGTVNGLTISNSAFNNLHYGIYFAKNPAGANPSPDTTSNVNTVLITDSSFDSNGFKGIYVEKLSNATFTNISASNNGQNTTSGLAAHNAGIDINLKNGNYSNITFNNPTVTGNGLGVTQGKGIAIKGRNDTAGYGLNTTTLDLVTINGGTITGNGGTTASGGGISIGNYVTNVEIHGVTISGNNNYGLSNWTTTVTGDPTTTVLIDARGNNWGDATGPNDTTGGDGSIPETNSGGTGNSVLGMVDYTELDTTPPESPLFFLEEDTNEILVTWKAVSNATLYRVYADNNTITPIYEGTDLSYTHSTTGLHNYIVTAVDSAGNESDSAIEWKYAEPMDIVIDDSALYSDHNNNGTFSVSGANMAIHVNHSDPSVQAIASSYVGGDTQTLRSTSATATWTTNDLLNGVYEVYTQYRCEPSASRGEVEYTINSGSPVTIDQATCAVTYEQSQSGWVSLGEYTFVNEQGSVVLQGPGLSGGQIAIADAVGFRFVQPLTPVQIGYNVNDGTPISQRPTRYDCEGGYTNINGVSVHWTDVSAGNPNIQYQRQYSSNGTSWAGLEPYTNPYTNYRSFGYGQVPHYSRVRAIDTLTGAVSDWSNTCYITYDVTPPVVTFIDDVEAGFNLEDIISILVTDNNPDPSTYQYAFTDGTCDNTVVFTESFESNTPFTIADESHNGMYVCVKATDLANNTTYTVSTYPLNIDNTAPTISTIDDLILTEGQLLNLGFLNDLEMRDTNGNLDMVYVVITFTDPDGTYTILDTAIDVSMAGCGYDGCGYGGTLNELFHYLTGETIDFSDIDVPTDTSYIPEGVYTIRYYVTDFAGNESEAYLVTITINNVAPAVVLGSNQIIETGGVANFTAMFGDPSYISDPGWIQEVPDDSPWYAEIDYGTGEGFQSLGTFGTPGNITIPSKQYLAAGIYTVTLRVCEARFIDNPLSENTCTTKSVTVTVNPPVVIIIPQPIVTIRPVIQPIIPIEPVSEPESLEPEEEDLDNNILGTTEERCSITYKISGYVYEDKNKNDKKDENEKIFTNQKILVEYEFDGKTYQMEAITDDNGYWELKVCPGKYTVKIIDDELPSKYSLGENKTIEVTDKDTADVNIRLIGNNRFPWWILIPILVFILLVIGIILSRRKQEK